MDRIHGASFMTLDRPLLGQMAIATVLVGSAAALSSAGIAVPISQVDYAKGWDKLTPAAAFVPAAYAAPVAPSARISAPTLVATPPPRISLEAPRTAIFLAEPPATMSRIEPAQSLRLVTPAASGITPAPSLAEIAPLPIEDPLPALALPTAPLLAPSAAPVSLAVAVPSPVRESVQPSEAARPVEAAAPLRLVNPPELRGFDLARMARTPKSVPAGFAKPATKSPVSGKIEGLGKKDTVVGDAVFHQVTLSVAGSDAKAIDVRIGTDMKPSIKVGDLLGLVSDRMDPDSAARFAAAASAGDYVSLATLRAAGFDVSYNAGLDSISISSSQ